MVCFQFQPFIALPLSHWWGQVMEAQEPSFRSSSRVEEQRLASTSLSRGVSPKMFPPWWETHLSNSNLPTFTRLSGWWGGSEAKFQDGDASGSWSRSWWAKTQNYSANVQCWSELWLNECSEQKCFSTRLVTTTFATTLARAHSFATLALTSQLMWAQRCITMSPIPTIC